MILINYIMSGVGVTPTPIFLFCGCVCGRIMYSFLAKIGKNTVKRQKIAKNGGFLRVVAVFAGWGGVCGVLSVVMGKMSKSGFG